jgi:hypothetical protein
MGPARSGRHILRRLDTSNGCQDHTTWPYAARPTPRVSTGLVPTRRSLTKSGLASVVSVPSLRSRAHESPPCDDVCAPDAAASTAPRPAFSDDRETPPLGGRDTGGCKGDLGETRSGLFLREGVFLFASWGKSMLRESPSILSLCS